MPIGRDLYHAFLDGGVLVCAIMIVVWTFRLRSRGLSAYLMSTAFVVLGALFVALRREAPTWVIATLAISLAMVLGADVVVRSAEHYRKSRGPQ
jgi:hypothetical protein